MLIVEYCRFGDLRSFLVNSRNNFVNQILDQLKTGFATEERGRERTEMQRSILSATNEAFEMSEIPISKSLIVIHNRVIYIVLMD